MRDEDLWKLGAVMIVGLYIVLQFGLPSVFPIKVVDYDTYQLQQNLTASQNAYNDLANKYSKLNDFVESKRDKTAETVSSNMWLGIEIIFFGSVWTVMIYMFVNDRRKDRIKELEKEQLDNSLKIRELESKSEKDVREYNAIIQAKNTMIKKLERKRKR